MYFGFSPFYPLDTEEMGSDIFDETESSSDCTVTAIYSLTKEIAIKIEKSGTEISDIQQDSVGKTEETKAKQENIKTPAKRARTRSLSCDNCIGCVNDAKRYTPEHGTPKHQKKNGADKVPKKKK